MKMNINLQLLSIPFFPHAHLKTSMVLLHFWEKDLCHFLGWMEIMLVRKIMEKMICLMMDHKLVRRKEDSIWNK
ncbi:hypothetical protein KY285_022979 [Solanum tuberosum]|nr:hypothetical protein KY285_022979 [Solanum tuberosum]